MRKKLGREVRLPHKPSLIAMFPECSQIAQGKEGALRLYRPNARSLLY